MNTPTTLVWQVRRLGLHVLALAILIEVAASPALGANSIDRYPGGPYRFGISVDPGQGFVPSTYRYNWQNYVEGDAGTRLGIHEWTSSGKMIYKVRGYGKFDVEHSKLRTRAACGNSDFDTTRIRDCHTLFYFYRAGAAAPPKAAVCVPRPDLPPYCPTPSDAPPPPGCPETSADGKALCWAQWLDYTPPVDAWAVSDPASEASWQEQTALRFGFGITSNPTRRASAITLTPVEIFDGNGVIESFETTYESTFPTVLRMGQLPADYSHAVLAANGTTGMQLWAAPGSDRGDVCLLAVSISRRYGMCGSRKLALKNGITFAFSDAGLYTIAGFIRNDARTVQLDGHIAPVHGGFFVLSNVSPKAMARPVLGFNANGHKVAAVWL
jgi:hypothetical protein